MRMLPDHSDDLRGRQRQAHDEMDAERLLAAALDILNMSENELLGMKSVMPEKQAVAWLGARALCAS